ncbi:hypothetical protein J7E91_09100 [Streptomyces sp. ISL-99]|uniref:hypothetical protein n=1 Tax=Streptomyces sp. ISL-99 TaxID=2819193 RepID=UPI001BE8577C|nr:hypothetical protein [Streptomyces sp. ISL-99]MBT2525586.1 hypothetical protein [Streptomyces sp. ISL-99]
MGESANDDIWILWIGAGLFIVAGFVLALNVRGAAERFFDLVARQMPFTGSATPKTLRIVGGGWIVVGFLMLLPDLISLGRAG